MPITCMLSHQKLGQVTLARAGPVTSGIVHLVGMNGTQAANSTMATRINALITDRLVTELGCGLHFGMF